MTEQLELFDQPIPSMVDCLTFNQAVRLFRSLHWDRKKMAAHADSLVKYIVEFFDGRLFHQIGRQDVEAFLHWLENVKRLGIATRNKAHMIGALIYSKHEQWKTDRWAGGYNFSGLELPPKNPFSLVSKLKDPARDRYIEPREFRQYIKFAKRLNDWDMVDNFRLGIWLRLSPIDLENFNDDEVDEERMQVKIYRRHTKTDKNPQGVLQIIPITEKIWGLINRRRMFRRPGDKLILNFTNKKRRLNKIRKLAREAGMKDFTWMDLRRAGSGHLHEKGVDLKTRAEGLGHTGTKIAQHHYTPKTKTHLRRSTEILEKSFS